MDFKIIKSAKISFKLTMVYAFMFSLILLILNASTLYGIKYYLYNQANKQVRDSKIIMLKKISSQEHSDLSDKDIFIDIPSNEAVFIKIISENGRLINSSKGFDYNIKNKEPSDKIKHYEDDDKKILFLNFKVESKEYGEVNIQIVKDMNNEYDFLKILFIVMAVADFIGIISSIILGYVISKKMMKPIDNISKAADNISINNLKERIEVTGPDDELKRLANTFNKMIDRLQESFNRQTQFVCDASHELRTPIAIIQGYANLLDRWGKDDKEALEKSIGAIKMESSSMATLVERLLFLAKGDTGNQKIDKTNLSLNKLIDEVVNESNLIYENHKIVSSENQDINILADSKMIKQMLRIFIDNSVKFTNNESIIDIKSIIQNNKVNISVSDCGIGIPKEEFENMFQRFYTIDKSRSKEIGGSGLGLSIAKWIVDVHEGTIAVESEEGIGTKITVTLDVVN